jgi:hypothetical protein
VDTYHTLCLKLATDTPPTSKNYKFHKNQEINIIFLFAKRF